MFKHDHIFHEREQETILNTHIDTLAVIARSVFDETDMYSGRRVMMRAGFGDERWWDSSNEKHWEDDELTDVTPLIEAKVTDEMVKRVIYRAESLGYIERVFGEVDGIDHNAMAELAAAALGLETA